MFSDFFFFFFFFLALLDEVEVYVNTQAVQTSLNQGNYLDCTNCTIENSMFNSYFGTLHFILEGIVDLHSVDFLAVSFKGKALPSPSPPPFSPMGEEKKIDFFFFFFFFLRYCYA